MNDKEKLRIKNALMVCAELFNRNLSEGVLEIYISSLKDYPVDKVLHALKSCTQEISYMPSLADILQRIEKKGDADALSELAWSYVLGVIGVCGIYESFTFRDKIIRKTLSLMDYEMLCICGRSEIHWKKKEFIESYKSFLKINNYDAPNYFSGVLELNNGDLWTDIVGQTKVYVAEDGKFVNIDKLNEFIEGYKPALKLIKKNDVKTIEKGVLNGK
jgi:hypothetical protein